MIWLALKTFFHEKVRLITTLTGIIFSTVLTITQISMYFGFMGNATTIIRHTDADIWVASKNIQTFDFANPIPEDRLNKVRSVPEVEIADRLILWWGFLKLPTGGQEQVQIVGFNPDSGLGAPWSMIAGEPYDVKGGRYMIIDKTSEQRLGRIEPGQTWELTGKRFKLVGLTNGIKTFTTSPLVFMSYNEAKLFFPAASATYILAKVRDKSKIPAVVATLKSTMKDNDVFSKDEFIAKTVRYWTIQTGMGMGFFITAILGLVIGGVIVGQTIYSNTMEHIQEFGTLKAVGARNSDLYVIIFVQAAISAIIGFIIGSALILLMKGGIESGGVTLHLSASLFIAIFFTIFVTCVLSAYFSIKKVKKLDPVSVFRG